MITAIGEFCTLSLLSASGTGGGFSSEVKIIKMMSRTNNTSVNGVMLMVDITSSSGLDPTIDISNTSLLRHEADVVIICRTCRVEDLDDGVITCGRVGDQRDMREIALRRVLLVELDRGGHVVIQLR